VKNWIVPVHIKTHRTLIEFRNHSSYSRRTLALTCERSSDNEGQSLASAARFVLTPEVSELHLISLDSHP
jgi:hypothetical protein